MISSEYDYNFLITRELDNLASDFIKSMRQLWPSAIIFDDSIKGKIEDIAIYRDSDMEKSATGHPFCLSDRWMSGKARIYTQ